MRAPVGALALLVLAALLGGCSSLPFFGKKDDANATQPVGEPLVEQYAFEVEAPDPLKTLMTDFLDLSRFQKVPKSDAAVGRELDRLIAAAPAQAKQLLETQGYFDAEVTVAQSAGQNGLPKIVLTVEPGPRVIVESLAIDSTAPLASRKPTREDSETSRLDVMRRDWKLKPGEPFTQSAWSSSKTAALGELRTGGYPKADWQATHAKIDATDRTAALSVTVDSGPLYRIGPIRVNGINRYDEVAVRRLAGFNEGDVYTQKALLDYQERLLKVGLFQGASVTLDAEAGPPEAAPVTVELKELEQNQATFGLGYSTNTGPRFSIDHYNRALFGWKTIAHDTLVFGPSLKSLGTDLTSYPLDDFKRNLFGAKLEQLKTNDETRNAGLAARRALAGPRHLQPALLRRAVAHQGRERLPHHHGQRGCRPLPLGTPRCRQPAAADTRHRAAVAGWQRLRRGPRDAHRSARRRTRLRAVRSRLRPAQRLPAARLVVPEQPHRSGPGFHAQPHQRSRHAAVSCRRRRIGARLRLPGPRP